MPNPEAKYKGWMLGRSQAYGWWYGEHESGQWQTPPQSTRAELERYIDMLEVPR